MKRLREVLDYEPTTGVFRWRVAIGRRVQAGNVAGTLHPKGYRQITIDARKYRAPRLAWFYVHGCWPKNQIDHMNGNRDDNRIENLRDVTSSENLQNQRRAYSSSTTGFLGVSTHRKKFQARIMLDGKNRHLGTFPTPEAAHVVYLAAKRRLHAACMI